VRIFLLALRQCRGILLFLTLANIVMQPMFHKQNWIVALCAFALFLVSYIPVRRQIQ
jgi:hypothetical protein